MTHMLRWKPLDGDNIRNPYKMYEQLRSTEPVFLSQTHVQLKLATASGILVLSLTLNTAQAQTTANGPFASQPRHINPLREPFKFDGTTFPQQSILTKMAITTSL